MLHTLRILSCLLPLFIGFQQAFGQDVDAVSATGPGQGSTLEDRVEIVWPADSTIDVTSSYTIRRAVAPSSTHEVIGVAASTVTLYEDFTAVPGVIYDYCIAVRLANGTETTVGCDQGTRVIARPTGFEATDGLFEQNVMLSWSDRSEIEGGFNIYRDAGNAIDMDGVDDYVAVPGNTVLPGSFTIEFWASLASFSGDRFVVNLEDSPQGDPTTLDLEIGFNNINEFEVSFGSNTLSVPSGISTSAWHHWAVTYDAQSRERTIYLDGIEIASDVYTQTFKSSGNLEFGRRSSIGNKNRMGWFHGLLDEVRLWNKALKASEIHGLLTDLRTGSDTSLISHWPMDVSSGNQVPDIKGTLSGTLLDPNNDPNDWSPSGVPDYHTEIGANLTAYVDPATVPGYESYNYRLAAYEDINDNGSYDAGTDFESLQQTDDGWRAILSPPGNVDATDGQFTDRVRIIWTDRSDSETSFKVYRDGSLAGSVPADSTRYFDLGASGLHEYCVAASNGVESIRVCDFGMAGGLPAPDSVKASNGTFDDRVQITWLDTTDTEDGFEIFRDGIKIASTEADAQEYGDFSAAQDSAYSYCVRAISEADPENPSYSDEVCAPTMGLRLAVLPPEDVSATDNEFEERVDLAWTNPSTTAMLFKVYRDSMLIEVLDYNMTKTKDSGILSDHDYNYCISSETVIAPGGSAATAKGIAAQVLEDIHYQDAVRAETGGLQTEPETTLAMVYEALGLDRNQLSKSGAGDASGFAESEWVCDLGSRLLAAPTEVDATDDEFEDHVQVNWLDNSQFEKGYYILRGPVGGTPVPIDTISSNRTTYGDFSGTPGVQFNYVVEAFDKDDTSSPDGDLGKRTLKPPTGLTASDGTSETVVEIEWSDNSSAEKGYNIYRRIPGMPDSVLAGRTGRNEPAFEDLVPDSVLGMEFQYIVTAFDDYGESLRASDRGKTRVEAPINVNASDVYTDRTVVVWVDRSMIEDGYRLTRRPFGTSSGGAIDMLLAPGTTTYTDLAGGAGVEYEYCVSAVLQSNGGTLASEEQCDVGQKFRESGGGVPPGVTAVKIWSPYIRSTRDLFVGFGSGVAFDGSNALFGAPGADAENTGLLGGFQSSGLVDRYTFDAQNSWSRIESWPRFDFLDQPDDVDFGYAVDIDGMYAIVGDPAVLQPSRGGFSAWKMVGALWVEMFQKIELSGPGDNTGISVALSDSFAVVGNSARSEGLPSGHGSAILCNIEAAIRNGTDCGREDNVPRFELVLTAAQRVEDAAFGQAVGITRVADSLYAIVGAPGNDLAFIFKCVVGTGCDQTADWTLIKELNTRFRPGNNFGAGVAISPKLAIVGAPDAAGVVIYQRHDGDWDEMAVFSPTNDAAGFGSAIAINDTTVIVGAPNEEVGGYENAGAAYVVQWDAATSSFVDLVRYDARVANERPGVDGVVAVEALFGAAVDISPDFYLVGAPHDDNNLFGGRQFAGAAYSIPVGFPPPESLILPPGVDLAIPGNVRASDGTAPDRIQVRWDDESDDEDGHTVFRSNVKGEIEELSDVSPNIEFFDDFDAAPGEAYTYCVAAFYQGTYTDMRCDIGWRPPNGTIAGRLASRQGGGTEDAQVCLVPSPNMSLLFDGHGGHVSAALAEDDLDLFNDFTIEAWIRPHAIGGLQYIASKDSAYALAINGDHVQFQMYDVGSIDAVVNPTIVAGNWYHVAASVDRDRNVAVYLNGVKQSEETFPSLGNTIGDTLSIGQRGDGSGFFNGEIDELRIWDVALADSLIRDRRFMPLLGDEENLVGYWPLDQGNRRVAPDVSETASHGRLIDGVYLADEGAPLDICDITSSEGNYSISDIRYGESTEFNVIPKRQGRDFSPSFKKITLTKESPAQNEVVFTDVTAFDVSGEVQFVDIIASDTLACPVPDVVIHVGKGDVATSDNVRTTTGADGAYVVAVDPSVDPQDFWYVIPEYTDPQNDELVHTFTPANTQLLATAAVGDVNFSDLRRHTLSGNFSGGDPSTCGKDIGKATIHIYTQDGCYDRMITVNSDSANGAFALDLPPLQYLMEIVDIEDAPAKREDEIKEFFENLGTVEVDLRQGDAERNLIYRAPLTLAIEGLDAPMCPTGVITQLDEDQNVLRTLPEVPIIGEYEFVPITIKVEEDYGNGETCGVDEGKVAIFDAIADRVDVDTTVDLHDGMATYVTVGASPNIFSGARIQGVDRSFQKPITFVAQVEGRDFLTETRWAMVEGFRERSSTFVSATTGEFPLMILHDPPGSESFSFIEKGSRYCSQLSSTKVVGGGGGLLLDVGLGFKARTGTAGFGFHFTTKFGTGLLINTRTVLGVNSESLWDQNRNGEADDNIEICLSTTENFSTYGDPTWVGEDIHIGLALNLIFAIADVLDVDKAACTVDLSETLAADLDESDPFETTYAFGTSHIALSLIPELENLIKLAGGDATIEGEIDGRNTKIRLEQALNNWKAQLANNENLQEQALSDPDINRSFSGGTEFTYTETYDTTAVTRHESTELYINSDNAIGAVFTAGDYDNKVAVAFEVNSSWTQVEDSTESTSNTVGYTLKDGDTGDYFSVDIAKDPRYGTPVFKTISGRSSNPHEANTQLRDNPIIMVDPPVLYNVDPNGNADFELTLINASESNERRLYTMGVPGQTNPHNLGITVTGDLLGGNRLESFLLDPGKAITINMEAYPVAPVFAYKRVGVVLYPENEFNIWLADVRQPFALADTAFFSVYFDSTGGGALAAPMNEGWTWFSVNRSGGDVNAVLKNIPAQQGDILRSQDAESQFDSTAGWTGELRNLVPGEGYRIKLHEPTIFRVVGEAVESYDPIDLNAGWNWVGYMPSRRLPLNTALASLKETVKEGDEIVGQSSFAHYVDKIGWVGTMREMVPGESYALNLTSSGNLAYPTDIEDVPRLPISTREQTIMGPDWQLSPERFDNTLTMVADVRLDGRTLDQTTTKVAVFAGDSLRGVGDVRFIEDLNKYLAFVMIYRDSNEEDVPMTVDVYDGESNTLYEDVGTVHFTQQDMIGHPASPVVIELSAAGQAPELLDLPEEFRLYANYPNPFNPSTTIAYDLPSAASVRLLVYDVLGRKVTTLVDHDQKAGRYKVTFDATDLASGFYLYRIEAGDFAEVHKMILVK